MPNKLIDKICDVNCTPNELKNFVIDIDKKEFNLDNPFSKYYDVEKIIHVIEEYQTHKIDAEFLSSWMNAYNWIIMGGFKNSNKNTSLTEFLMCEISEWLDSLAFFDDCVDVYDLAEYKTTFRILDKVLKDVNDCEATFSDDCNEDRLVLITNDKAKYFIEISRNVGFTDENILLPKVPYDEIENKVEQLKEQGYTELPYSQQNVES